MATQAGIPASVALGVIRGIYQPTIWVGVPDFRLAPLIATVPTDRMVTAPREDLAVGAAFGATLAGGRAICYMKDAGLGHCIDALLTSFREADLPIHLLVSTAPSPSGPRHHAIWNDSLMDILRSLHFLEPVIWAQLIADSAAHTSLEARVAAGGSTCLIIEGRIVSA